jgi:hypothetical protein
LLPDLYDLLMFGFELRIVFQEQSFRYLGVTTLVSYSEIRPETLSHDSGPVLRESLVRPASTGNVRTEWTKMKRASRNRDSVPVTKRLSTARVVPKSNSAIVVDRILLLFSDDPIIGDPRDPRFSVVLKQNL